jgi:chromate transporter
VVGIVLAALYNPVRVNGILGPADLALAIVAFLLLVFWRVPPWLVAVLGATATARPM